ncbi:hypothetical protein LB54_12590, partial [Salmonella enterica subsp. enterica]|nr:hypothetical protein [Salmonella enterica subsp. enterica]
RVNPEFQDFSLQPTGCLCEVIHIRRVDGGALWGVGSGRQAEKCIFVLTAHLLSITLIFAAFLSPMAGRQGCLTPSPPRFLLLP